LERFKLEYSEIQHIQLFRSERREKHFQWLGRAGKERWIIGLQ
jgi:hypothetical protein